MPGSLDPITVTAERLSTPDGRPFFPVIVNYVGHLDRAWEQFQPGKFDAALIEADFRRAREFGANTIRTFVDDPLQNEFPKGNWAKLDALVGAAEAAGVYLLLALADYNLSYIQTVAAHAGLIAARYRGRPAILAYDLKNEPRFNDILFLHYPQPLPLLAEAWTAPVALAHTGEDALTWARTEGKAPTWFGDSQASRYGEARAAWDACLDAISEWVAAQRYAAGHAAFLRSAEAAPWRSFLSSLDATLRAWLRPQLDAIRAADPGRPLTVAYSDPLLAALPANAALDIMAVNRYPRDLSQRQLEFQMTLAAELQAAFPGKPVLLTELGYSTADLAPGRAAAAEAAGWLRAFELGLAGIGKWMLWDLPPGPNPRERAFGLLDAAGRPKPGAWALRGVAGITTSRAGPRGRTTLTAEADAAVAFRYEAAGVAAVAGLAAADAPALRWAGSDWGQATARVTRPGEVLIEATAPGEVTLDLAGLLGLDAAPRCALTAGAAPIPAAQTGAQLRFAVTPAASVVCRIAAEAVDARTVILWPHGSAAAADARLANLTAYLTYRGSRMAVPCDLAAQVTLWRGLNNEPAGPIATGVRRVAEVEGRRVPVWDFNDVDVSAARDPHNKLYFTLQVADLPYRSNVWVHGVDARTYMPQQVKPQGEAIGTFSNPPKELDARIQILWPHGNAAVADARLANLTADLFQHGTQVRLSPERAGSEYQPPIRLATWLPEVWLMRAVDNGVGERVSRGALRREGAAGRWDFNDVDVSPARDPAHKLHFWVEVGGVRTYSNFWTHGLDARTYLPHPETPLGDCA
jgi:hypothetical protein